MEKITTSIGTFWVPANAENDWIISAMRKDEVFDGFVVNKLADMDKGEGDIYDVGSNFGQLSVQFYRALVLNKPSRRVVSFEANPSIISYLDRNLKENIPRDNSELIFGAVYNKVGRRVTFPKFDPNKEVTYGSYGINNGDGQMEDEGYPVSTVTIDSVRDRSVGVIKVDVQGSDLRVMEGAVHTISKDRPIICIEFESKLAGRFCDKYSDYLYFFKFMNYKVIAGLKEPPVTGDWNTNLFCMPSESV